MAAVMTLGCSGEKFVGGELLIAPLIGVEIPEARAVHLARRPVPVQGKGDGCPARLRTELLLPDVVCPAPAALPHAAAEVQEVHDGPVGHVVVVPVVDP